MSPEPKTKSRFNVMRRGWGNVVRWFETVDQVLRRQPIEFTASDAKGGEGRISLRRTASIVMVFGPVYGAAMGAYAWVAGERTLLDQIPQMFYSGIKVPLLIAVTVLISLPSFFVINTLLGLRDDFRDSLTAIISAQAGMVMILASLFPLTLFVYVSTSHMDVSYPLAILANAGMFGLASVSAQVLLRGYYSPLVTKNARHRWMVRSWILVYAFVGIQASYVLRPFIGNPGTPVSFFRKDSFENAYVRVFELTADVIRGFFQ